MYKIAGSCEHAQSLSIKKICAGIFQTVNQGLIEWGEVIRENCNVR